ncbi:protein phosphatase CheZ [Microvirga terricola]|uniref:Protein phosphatase CheZ n=1 Tax=Microvirga terricola TaxID=2719797 RepID=A0ABX0VGF5_9HYPH|nr:protein phosphatase CheZ [Microvirga terricola]NIX78426.1 protein phosphatase CheZ [Microvirga terricola]
MSINGLKNRKNYRIESAVADGLIHQDAAERHSEIMGALASLRELITPTQEVSQSLLEEHRRDLHEAMRLKVELDAISSAIQRTKQEIATLHYAGAQGREIAKVTDELGAIVLGTESATNTILAAVERIDEVAANLAARLSGDDKEMAREIAEQVISVFEACNFQDITGQRISKVVSAMRFIDERVRQMIDIWGGLESFKEVETVKDPARDGDKALLNGPPLEGDVDCTSQDAIDALFG